MTAQRYVHDILQLHTLLLMNLLPGAIFQQDNDCPHTSRVSQEYFSSVTTLPLPVRSRDVSLIEHMWGHLGRRVGYSTCSNELETRLQQIWNEMAQGLIQNLYASIPDHIALSHARGGSTGY
ncbi:transposable element Tcb1 transposase [Trichonephila clavipes]|nr:transposable element Tcb1 transposase [Trichonephila clavipes]